MGQLDVTKLDLDLRSDLVKNFQKNSLSLYEMHRSNQLDHLVSIINPPPSKQQIELVQLSHPTSKKQTSNDVEMIDQIFKTILRGSRNFYRKH